MQPRLINFLSDGMFPILIPISLFPLIATLLWAERKARKQGVTSTRTDPPKLSVFARVISVAEKLDVLRLLLIGTSTAPILLPLTLRHSTKGCWSNDMHSFIRPRALTEYPRQRP